MPEFDAIEPPNDAPLQSGNNAYLLAPGGDYQIPPTTGNGGDNVPKLALYDGTRRLEPSADGDDGPPPPNDGPPPHNDGAPPPSDGSPDLRRDANGRIISENTPGGKRNITYIGDSSTPSSLSYQSEDGSQKVTYKLDEDGNYTARLPNGEDRTLRHIAVNQDTGAIDTKEMNGELRTESPNGRLQRYSPEGYAISDSNPQKNQLTTFDHGNQLATVTDTRTGEKTQRPMTAKELKSIYPDNPVRDADGSAADR